MSPDDTLALAVYQHVKAETNSCVMATPQGSSVHADFGGGCTLGTGALLYGGTVDAVITHPTSATVSVTLTLDGTVDGQPFAGTFVVSTPDGNAFDYAGDLTLDAAHATYATLSAGVASQGAQGSGMGTLDQPEGTLSLSLVAVHQRFTGCYADEGEIDLELGGMTVGLGFASGTPQSGTATWAVGKSAPTDVMLPARMGCKP
jgi:hypothetical protein